jgi:enoyl-CoA hydratase
MAEKTVLVETDGGIATVTLNRPESLNALSSQLNRDLRSVLEALREDRGVRVIIVTGAGDRAFSAGRDLKEYGDYTATPIEDWERRVRQNENAGLAGMPQPTIAAINGFAIAGGLEVALSCDIRIASDRATFGLFEIRRGFFPGGGATWRLAPLVGKGWAMELLLGGDTITAEVAERIGLVNRVVPHDQLLAAARDLAGKIAQKSPAAVRLAKAAINQTMAAYERTAFDITVALRALAETNEDVREGTRAFVEKREARFTE